MTVIAWDGVTLASDGLVLDDHWQIFQTDGVKVRSFKEDHKYAAAGICGSLDHGYEMLDWVEAGCNPKSMPSFESSETELLIIAWDGVVWTTGHSGYLYPAGKGPRSTGSGSSYAASVMLLGYDAITAVRATATLNRMIGGTGTAFNLTTKETARFACDPLPQVALKAQ